MLVLASSSPYRRIQLERLGVPFEVFSPDVDETPLTGEPADATALRLAKAKAYKAAQTFPEAHLIACDQVAVCDGLRLGKPHTHENAVRQLQQQRGKSVIFHSALCLYTAKTDRMQATVVPTTVHFRMLSDTQIEDYLRREQPYDCAGSAKSEGLGIALIQSIESLDPNALMGLPLIALVTMLENAGISVLSENTA